MKFLFQTLSDLPAFVRFIVPYGLILFLFLMDQVAVSFPVIGDIQAPLFLMGVYYWTIYRPGLLPSSALFGAGILQDLLAGTPPGLHALLFTAMKWAISSQRRYLTGQSFFMIWVGFIISIAILECVKWFLFCLINWKLLALSLILPPVFSGAALFPLVCALLQATHRVLPHPSGQRLV